ncbi:MAG: twin-arginine translocation signal domain-containing protein [Candidatus Omnitrophica bacterium]|nr:twin-arginine translocation signal domain-containing protein [Candidatus Omnitrophota bacterium]
MGTQLIPAGYGEITPSRAISIPSRLGTVEEFHRGPSGKTVLYIQDAHDSLEAQKNIAKMIHLLAGREKIQTVFEEGYEGPVPTDRYFRFIKNLKIREKVSYFFLDKLRLGAAEYAHINRKRDFKLIGADNLKLHRENIAAYRKAAKHQKSLVEDIDVMLSEIKNLSDQYFPAKFKEWMKDKEKYEKGDLELGDYLKRHLISSEIKSIAPKTFFEEMVLLENNIATAYLTTSRDLKIFEYYKNLGLLRRLALLRLTSIEYASASPILKNTRTQEIAGFIAREGKKSLALSKQWEPGIHHAMKFYEIAGRRDEMIEKRLRQFLNQPAENTAVLVFGGFHKENIQRTLTGLGYSHYLITPKISGEDPVHQAYYKQLMAVGHHAFEKPFLPAAADRAPSILMERFAGPLIQDVSGIVFRNPDLSPELIARKLKRPLNPGVSFSEARAIQNKSAMEIFSFWKNSKQTIDQEKIRLKKNRRAALRLAGFFIFLSMPLAASVFILIGFTGGLGGLFQKIYTAYAVTLLLAGPVTFFVADRYYLRAVQRLDDDIEAFDEFHDTVLSELKRWWQTPSGVSSKKLPVLEKKIVGDLAVSLNPIHIKKMIGAVLAVAAYLENHRFPRFYLRPALSAYSPELASKLHSFFELTRSETRTEIIPREIFQMLEQFPQPPYGSNTALVLVPSTLQKPGKAGKAMLIIENKSGVTKKRQYDLPSSIDSRLKTGNYNATLYIPAGSSTMIEIMHITQSVLDIGPDQKQLQKKYPAYLILVDENPFEPLWGKAWPKVVKIFMNPADGESDVQEWESIQPLLPQMQIFWAGLKAKEEELERKFAGLNENTRLALHSTAQLRRAYVWDKIGTERWEALRDQLYAFNEETNSVYDKFRFYRRKTKALVEDFLKRYRSVSSQNVQAFLRNFRNAYKLYHDGAQKALNELIAAITRRDQILDEMKRALAASENDSDKGRSEMRTAQENDPLFKNSVSRRNFLKTAGAAVSTATTGGSIQTFVTTGMIDSLCHLVAVPMIPSEYLMDQFEKDPRIALLNWMQENALGFQASEMQDRSRFSNRAAKLFLSGVTTGLSEASQQERYFKNPSSVRLVPQKQFTGRLRFLNLLGGNPSRDSQDFVAYWEVLAKKVLAKRIRWLNFLRKNPETSITNIQAAWEGINDVRAVQRQLRKFSFLPAEQQIDVLTQIYGARSNFLNDWLVKFQPQVVKSFEELYDSMQRFSKKENRVEPTEKVPISQDILRLFSQIAAILKHSENPLLKLYFGPHLGRLQKKFSDFEHSYRLMQNSYAITESDYRDLKDLTDRIRLFQKAFIPEPPPIRSEMRTEKSTADPRSRNAHPLDLRYFPIVIADFIEDTLQTAKNASSWKRQLTVYLLTVIPPIAYLGIEFLILGASWTPFLILSGVVAFSALIPAISVWRALIKDRNHTFQSTLRQAYRTLKIHPLSSLVEIAKRSALTHLIPQEIETLEAFVKILPSNLEFRVFHDLREWLWDVQSEIGAMFYLPYMRHGVHEIGMLDFFASPSFLSHEFVHLLQDLARQKSGRDASIDLTEQMEKFMETKNLKESSLGQAWKTWKENLVLSDYEETSIPEEFSSYFYHTLWALEWKQDERHMGPDYEARAPGRWDSRIGPFYEKVRQRKPGLQKMDEAMLDFIKALQTSVPAEDKAFLIRLFRDHYQSLHPQIPLPELLKDPASRSEARQNGKTLVENYSHSIAQIWLPKTEDNYGFMGAVIGEDEKHYYVLTLGHAFHSHKNEILGTFYDDPSPVPAKLEYLEKTNAVKDLAVLSFPKSAFGSSFKLKPLRISSHTLSRFKRKPLHLDFVHWKEAKSNIQHKIQLKISRRIARLKKGVKHSLLELRKAPFAHGICGSPLCVAGRLAGMAAWFIATQQKNGTWESEKFPDFMAMPATTLREFVQRWEKYRKWREAYEKKWTNGQDLIPTQDISWEEVEGDDYERTLENAWGLVDPFYPKPEKIDGKTRTLAEQMMTVMRIAALRGFMAHGLTWTAYQNYSDFKEIFAEDAYYYFAKAISNNHLPFSNAEFPYLWVDNEGRLFNPTTGQPVFGNFDGVFNSEVPLVDYRQANSFGYAWVMLSPEVRQLGNLDPISSQYHLYYLVPTSRDREEMREEINDSLILEAKERSSRILAETLPKIITYAEFIRQHSDLLNTAPETRVMTKKEAIPIDITVRINAIWSETTKDLLEDDDAVIASVIDRYEGVDHPTRRLALRLAVGSEHTPLFEKALAVLKNPSEPAGIVNYTLFVLDQSKDIHRSLVYKTLKSYIWSENYQQRIIALEGLSNIHYPLPISLLSVIENSYEAETDEAIRLYMETILRKYYRSPSLLSDTPEFFRNFKVESRKNLDAALEQIWGVHYRSHDSDDGESFFDLNTSLKSFYAAIDNAQDRGILYLMPIGDPKTLKDGDYMIDFSKTSLGIYRHEALGLTDLSAGVFITKPKEVQERLLEISLTSRKIVFGATALSEMRTDKVFVIEQPQKEGPVSLGKTVIKTPGDLGEILKSDAFENHYLEALLSLDPPWLMLRKRDWTIEADISRGPYLADAFEALDAEKWTDGRAQLIIDEIDAILGREESFSRAIFSRLANMETSLRIHRLIPLKTMGELIRMAAADFASQNLKPFKDHKARLQDYLRPLMSLRNLIIRGSKEITENTLYRYSPPGKTKTEPKASDENAAQLAAASPEEIIRSYQRHTTPEIIGAVKALNADEVTKLESELVLMLNHFSDASMETTILQALEKRKVLGQKLLGLIAERGLRSPHLETQTSALKILTASHFTGYGEKITGLLSSKDIEVRLLALLALVQSQGRDSLVELWRLSADTHPFMRIAAAAAIKYFERYEDPAAAAANIFDVLFSGWIYGALEDLLKHPQIIRKAPLPVTAAPAQAVKKFLSAKSNKPADTKIAGPKITGNFGFLELLIGRHTFKGPVTKRLDELKIRTIGALSQKSIADLKGHGFNDTQIEHIREVLATFGVRLAGDSDYEVSDFFESTQVQKLWDSSLTDLFEFRPATEIALEKAGLLSVGQILLLSYRELEAKINNRAAEVEKKLTEKELRLRPGWQGNTQNLGPRKKTASIGRQAPPRSETREQPVKTKGMIFIPAKDMVRLSSEELFTEAYTQRSEVRFIVYGKLIPSTAEINAFLKLPNVSQVHTDSEETVLNRYAVPSGIAVRFVSNENGLRSGAVRPEVRKNLKAVLLRDQPGIVTFARLVATDALNRSEVREINGTVMPAEEFLKALDAGRRSKWAVAYAA